MGRQNLAGGTGQELYRGRARRIEQTAGGRVEQLSMFGLIEVRDGRYGFRDLASARQAAQLLGSGIGLSVITKSLREIR